jgi:hypothetical protein
MKLFLAIDVPDEEAAKFCLKVARRLPNFVAKTDGYCIGESLFKGFYPLGDEFETPQSESISVSTAGVPEPSILICSFCHKEPRAVDLVIGPGVSICSECVLAANRALAEQRPSSAELCCVCQLNWVDTASGEDTCAGCMGNV